MSVPLPQHATTTPTATAAVLPNKNALISSPTSSGYAHAVKVKLMEGYSRIIDFPAYAKTNYYDGRSKYKSLAIGMGFGAIIYLLRRFYKSCKNADERGSFIRGFVHNYWVPVLGDFRIFDLGIPQPIIHHRDQLHKPITWHYSEYDDFQMELFQIKSEIPSGIEEETPVPPEILFLLQATRVLGQFETSTLTAIWKGVELVSVAKGGILFTKGDADDQIYVLVDGLMEINSVELNGKSVQLKKVHPGGQLYSVLSFVDVMTRNSVPIKTVEAVALRNSTVIKIPCEVFRVLWMKDLDQMRRAIRRLIRRVYQVVFVALHKVLGLTIELVTHQVRRGLSSDNPMLLEAKTVTSEDTFEGIRGLIAFFQLTNTVDQATDPLFSKLRVLLFGANVELLQAGSRTSAFVYVYRGELEVSRMVDYDEREEKAHEQTMFYISEGQGLGGLSYLTDDVNIFNVRVPYKAMVIIIEEKQLETLCDQYPICILPIANSVVRKLSSFTRQIDFGIEWIHVNSSSQPIYRVGDEAEATYLVLSGRLRSVLIEKEKKIIIGEYGRNDWIGLVETLTKKKRSKTVLPVRDSELAKIPEGVLHMIKLKFPIVTIRLLDFLGNRIAKTYRSEVTDDQNRVEKMVHTLDSSHKGCSTVTLLPATRDIPTLCVAYEVLNCYQIQGTCKIVHCQDALNELGAEVFTKGNDYLLASWLAKQEEQHALVIYLAESKINYWSLRCARQADTILILVNADEPNDVSDLENTIKFHAPRAKKELVIMHNYRLTPTEKSFMPSRGLPRNTKRWLEPRKYLSFHHHIRIFPAHLILMHAKEEEVADYYENNWQYNKHSDFARLTRWLSGNATGLVLGGGGAKGAAHLGMIKSILEHEIPIDLVCGVSIGAFVGALYAAFQDITRVDEYCKDWFLHMTTWYSYMMDMTVPVVSLLQGEAFNESLKATFQDIQIEDLWLPYFCLTTDVTGSGPRTHKCGSIWKYCRASMTLAGYFPPMCDPVDGHYLMDGGYTNLVPANIMREFGARFIIAIDVSSEDDAGTTNFGDHLSGLRVVLHRFLPFLTEIKVPNLFKLQSQLSFIQSALYLNMVKKMDVASIYLRPPIDQWTGGDFTEFKEIKYTGYRYASEVFQFVNPNDSLIQQWISVNPRASLTHDEKLNQMFTQKETGQQVQVIRDPAHVPSRARSQVGMGLYEEISNKKKTTFFGLDE